MAIFNFEGKIPLQSDWLIIKDKGSAISRDISFNKCVDIKSCPALSVYMIDICDLLFTESSLPSVNITCVASEQTATYAAERIRLYTNR